MSHICVDIHTYTYSVHLPASLFLSACKIGKILEEFKAYFSTNFKKFMPTKVFQNINEN